MVPVVSAELWVYAMWLLYQGRCLRFVRVHRPTKFAQLKNVDGGDRVITLALVHRIPLVVRQFLMFAHYWAEDGPGLLVELSLLVLRVELSSRATRSSGIRTPGHLASLCCRVSGAWAIVIDGPGRWRIGASAIARVLARVRRDRGYWFRRRVC